MRACPGRQPTPQVQSCSPGEHSREDSRRHVVICEEVSDAGEDLVVLPVRKPARFLSGAGNAGEDSDADRHKLGRPQRPLHAKSHALTNPLRHSILAPSSSLARPGVHPPASQWDEAARQAWWEDIAIKFNKDQFLFLDESGKDGRTLYRHFGRVRRGVRATKATPLQHGQ
ncbi:hypothetical protein BU15DRAFT_67529 [Melanogaster broomeanus]|nr:hypothetical protein BU15DRAFT_67529 [Melanogaster broomeanus]